MAGRRSKKDLTNNKSRIEWKIGIYCRLSSDDGDNAESDSITNQRELINYHLKNKHDFKIIDYYVDDGFSGTSFNRPGFKRMVADLANGKINTIIVKDLSRFGRNYIEVGNYLEHIFPLYNVRFISVNDNIDSYEDPKSINNVVVPFKNIMNDEYARDISNKVKSVLLTKSKNGEFVGGTTPYGYKKDSNNIHKLVIEESEAKNVRLIYKKALNGEGILKICKYLNNNHILCRKEIQRRNKYSISLEDREVETKYHWSKTTVTNILTNETYIGNLVYNRTGSISYKNHKQVSKPKEEWIIVKNTHEGIVDIKDFEKVGELIGERRCNRKKPSQPSIFGWKIKCADCGHAMCKMEDFRGTRTCSHFYCRNYKTQSNVCSPHKIKTIDLNNQVLETILHQVKMVLNLEKTINKLKQDGIGSNYEQQYFNSVKKLNNDIDKLKRLKKLSYEDWKFQKISKEEFLMYSKDYDNRIESCNNEIRALENVYLENIKNFKKDDYWIEHFRRNKKVKALNKDVINELIECIYVYEGGNITIKFKYQDEYEKAIEFINGMEERVNEQMECRRLCEAI